MTRKKRLALAYLLSIGLNVVFWLAYARELRLNAPVPPVTPKSTLHTLTLGIYQPLPAVVKPKPSVSSLSRKKPGGNASQEDPSSAQQLAEAEKSADDAGQKNPSQSKGSADGTRQKGRDHSPASSHSRQSSVLAASALAASAPHFLPSVSAESEKPGEKTASEKTDAGKNAGKRTDARLARLAADLKRLQESRAGNGQPGSDSSQNQSDAAANALADAAGLSSAQLAALPPAQQQALMTALGMAPSSASAGDVDKKDGPDLKTPDAPAAPADKEKPLPQAQNVVLKVVKMWTPKPGQKFNLASNLNLILPPDLELVPGPPLTDDQIEQLRKLLSQQKLKHVTLNKKQLKRLIEAQRVAQNTRKKDTPAPGDDARHRTFKRLAAKPKPHTHVAAAHKPVEALERPNRPQSPFVFKPWNSDMYRRWTPNPAAMASDQHPPVEAPEAPDTPQTPNLSASANTPESGPQQTANAQVSANPQAPGAAAVASAQAAAQNAPSGNSHTNAGQGVLGGQPGSPSAATGQPATPSGAAGNGGKSSQTLGGTSQTTPGQNAGGAQQATGGAQQATGGAQQATGGNQETLGASAATNGGQPANASPTPGTPGTTTAAGNTSPQTGPQGNPPMAGGGGNPPMAGGGGNPPMAGGGGNPPMAGGGGNPPMAGGGGNPPMAGGGGNPPMAGGGGNPPMAGGGGNPPMAGGGGNPPMAGGGGNPPMAGGGGNPPMAGGGGNPPMAGGGGNPPMAGGGGNAPMAGGGGNAPMAGGGGNAPMAGGNSAAASTPGTEADGSLPGMGTGGASSIAGMSAGSPGAPGSPGMTGGVLAQEQSDGIADATGMGNAGDNTDSHDPTGFEPEANPTWPNPPTEDAHSGQHGIPGALILPPSPPMGTETGADPNPHPVKRTIITKPQGRTAVPPPLLAKLPAEPTPTGTEIAPRKKVPTPLGKPKKLALKPAAPALTVGSTSGRGQIAVYVADRPHLPLGAVSDVVDPPLPPALGTPQSRLLAPKRRAARAETADQAHMAVETTPPVLAETPAKAAKRTPLLVRLFKNSSGIKEGTEQPLPPTPLPDSDMQIGDGSGLKADYYLGRNFDQLAFSRADSNINFDFAGMPDGSPSPKIPAGSDYTARWTGKIAAKYSETYTIYASADDGVRIWIDHHLIINDWTPHGNEEFSNKFTFQAGEQYDIKVEYLEIDGGGANLNLYWQSPSQPKQFIPEESFFYPLPTDEDDMKKDKAPGE